MLQRLSETGITDGQWTSYFSKFDSARKLGDHVDTVQRHAIATSGKNDAIITL